jgi:hypothetical protein
VLYLIDNDIAIKLAQTDLLQEVCSMLELTASNTLRLGTLKFVCARKLEKQGLPGRIKSQIIRQISDFCNQYQTISEPEDPKILNQLSSPGIDPGETLLLAQAVMNPAAVLLTGDRRCVIALATDPNLTSVAQLLVGRLEISESVFLRLIDRLGFDPVRDRVLNAPPTDGMLNLAFRTRETDPEAHAREALLSAEAQIERILPGLLRRRLL